jgi:hypothetical protein
MVQLSATHPSESCAAAALVFNLPTRLIVKRLKLEVRGAGLPLGVGSGRRGGRAAALPRPIGRSAYANSSTQNCGSAAPGRASCHAVHGAFPSHRRELVHAGPTAPTRQHCALGFLTSCCNGQRQASASAPAPELFFYSHGPRPDTPSVRVASPLTLIMRCHAPGEPVRTARAVLCPCHTSRQAVGAYMHSCPRLATSGPGVRRRHHHSSRPPGFVTVAY